MCFIRYLRLVTLQVVSEVEETGGGYTTHGAKANRGESGRY